MSDPFDRSPMPGFPNLGSQHAIPPHLRDPRSNQLRPAVSAADAERAGRTPFGPPAGGWPFGKEQLSPIKQRTVDGISEFMQLAAPALPGPLQIGVGAMLGAVRQQIARMPDEQVGKMLEWLETKVAEWRTGETPHMTEAIGGGLVQDNVHDENHGRYDPNFAPPPVAE